MWHRHSCLCRFSPRLTIANLSGRRLRLEHKQASLEELGTRSDPPMTKDAVAGRIRRLLAMADKRAAELGLPARATAKPDRNVFTAFAKVGKFFWQQMTRIR